MTMSEIKLSDEQLGMMLLRVAEKPIDALRQDAVRFAALSIFDTYCGMVRAQLISSAGGASSRASSAQDDPFAALFAPKLRVLDIVNKQVFPDMFASISHGHKVSALASLTDWGLVPVEDVPDSIEMPTEKQSYNHGKGSRSRAVSRSTHRSNVLDRKPKRPPAIVDYAMTPRRPIVFSELRFFCWHPGRYLEGRISSNGINWNGNSTIIINHDDVARGQMKIMVFVTAKMPILHTKLAGTTLRVLDPYFRIDRAGKSGIRVDCAADVEFIPPPSTVRAPPLLAAAKQVGDDHLRANRIPTALRAYCAVFRGDHEVTPCEDAVLLRDLLNNLSVMLLTMDCCHEHALLAAAFVRFIDPLNSKAADRYQRAKERLGSSKMQSADVFLINGQLPSFDAASLVLEQPQAAKNEGETQEQKQNEDDSVVTPLEWKKRGNTVATTDPNQAAICYLRGLRHPALKLLGNVLSNMTRCFYLLGTFHLVLVTAPLAASLNPELKNKNAMFYALALQQLGAPHQARSLASTIDVSQDDTFMPSMQQIEAERAGKFDFEQFICGESKEPLAEFTHPAIRVAHFPGKGRGLVAAAEIKRGDLLIAARPIAASKSAITRDSPQYERWFADLSDSGDSALMMTYGNTVLRKQDCEMFGSLHSRCILPGSGALLHDVYSLCNFDADSQKAERATAIDLHQPRWKLGDPFLEPHRELGFDLGRICETCSANGFRLDDSSEKSCVFLVPSLLNHSHHPNTLRRSLPKNSNWYFFFAAKNIAVGEELTTLYFVPFSAWFSDKKEDDTAGPAKWGIDPLKPAPPASVQRMWRDIVNMGARKLTLPQITAHVEEVMAMNSDVLHISCKQLLLEKLMAHLTYAVGHKADVLLASPLLQRCLEFFEAEHCVFGHVFYLWACEFLYQVISSLEDQLSRSQRDSVTLKLLKAGVQRQSFGLLKKAVLAKLK